MSSEVIKFQPNLHVQVQLIYLYEDMSTLSYFNIHDITSLNHQISLQINF